ncbi:energy-coupling factor ABC transporter ATP-binding protein [Microbacterium amylolyticum]|uniref:Biotin transport system ATP-binding protein n=1 Tax=Microbacterium amylolyticum TaxID=936337 RepID=A0ABS4ZDS3_9MICO|nr:ABC transporter ATP-binding protein [Microbacterium amylolyticum]MBP2435425.1 biotin transport system ATP-binding protein [Microbacterium amylolyticum]
MIRTEGLDVARDGVRILHGITTTLDQPRVAIIGANGSGKSTFARTLNGLAKPTSGTVEVAGIDVGSRPKHAREAVGFLFSNPDAQILMPTPAEDIALSLTAAGVPRPEVSARAHQELANFGLDGRADQPAYSLSGGQKQLLALAAVLVRKPRVLVADEPTTLLDRGNARRMADLLLEGTDLEQVVIVTHDLDLAARCDVALRFADGRLVQQGEPSTVIDAYCREFA